MKKHQLPGCIEHADATQNRRKPLGKMFTFMVALATVWFVVLPFFWAYNTYQYIDRIDHDHIDYSPISYPQILSLYVPELAAGAVFLVCLPMIFLRPRFAVLGLPFGAALMAVLKLTVGSPADGWFVSALFLGFLSSRLHALTSGHPA